MLSSVAEALRRLVRHTCTLTLLVLTVACGSSEAAASDEPVLVDRILAVVDGHPVFLSGVRLARALTGQATEAAALEAVIDERLMLGEALRLGQHSPSESDVSEAVAGLRAKAPPGTPDQALARVARRQLGILRYVDSRFRPLVRVSEEAVRGAYAERYASRPEPPAWEDVAAALRAELERAQLDARVEAWISELRRSGQIRYAEPRRP